MPTVNQVITRLTGLSARRTAAPLIINGTAAPSGTSADIFCGFDTFGWPPETPPWINPQRGSLLVVLTFYAAYNPATDVQRAAQAKFCSTPESFIQPQFARPLIINGTAATPYNPATDVQRLSQPKLFSISEVFNQPQQGRPLLINGSAPPYNAGTDVQRLAQPKLFSIAEVFINPQLARPLLINGSAPIPYNPATDVQRARMAVTFSTPETFIRAAPFNQIIVNGQGAPVPPPPVLSTWNQPPMNFSLTVNGQSSVTLNWTPFGSVVVIGYYVWRDRVLLTPTPVTGGTYTDTTVSAGHRYMYAVSAVDASLAFGPQTLLLEADVLFATTLTFEAVFQEQPGEGGYPDISWKWD